MKFRTFYDRVEQNVPTYHEQNSGESRVKPNMTLSIKEIFDRWVRNEPLDLFLRNGSYMYDDDSFESDLDSPQIEFNDIGEAYEALTTCGDGALAEQHQQQSESDSESDANGAVQPSPSSQAVTPAEDVN